MLAAGCPDASFLHVGVGECKGHEWGREWHGGAMGGGGGRPYTTLQTSRENSLKRRWRG